VNNGIPLGCHLLLPIGTVNCVQTLKVVEALENGVSMYPKLEGRFPCVAGVTFTFDPTLPPNARVLASSVKVGGEPVDLAREYSVAVKAYLRQGKDGYTVFTKGRLISDEEDCPIIPTLIRNSFKALRYVACVWVVCCAVRYLVFCCLLLVG
jgi:5'-nucleotidase